MARYFRNTLTMAWSLLLLMLLTVTTVSHSSSYQPRSSCEMYLDMQDRSSSQNTPDVCEHALRVFFVKMIRQRDSYRPIMPFLPPLAQALIELLDNVLHKDFDEYRHFRESVLQDIRDQQNKHDIKRMKLKLQDIANMVRNMMVSMNPSSDMASHPQKLIDMMKRNELALKEVRMSDKEWEVFKMELTSLKTNLKMARSDFVLDSDHYLSLPYYNKYAITHITLLGIYYSLYANDSKIADQCAEEIYEAAIQHYDYLSLSIWELLMFTHKHESSQESCVKYSLYSNVATSHGFSINERLSCHHDQLAEKYGIQDLITISTLQVDTSTKSGDLVSFQHATLENDKWLSCTTFNSKCTFQSLKEEHNPFQYDCNKDDFVNSGVLFLIYGESKQDGETIKTCDKVSLCNGEYVAATYGNTWTKRISINGAGKARLDSCSGGVDWSFCPTHSFKLMVSGKGCGEVIHDHDAIMLTTQSNKVLSRGQTWRRRIDIGLQDANGCDTESAWIINNYESSNNDFFYHRDKLDNPSC